MFSVVLVLMDLLGQLVLLAFDLLALSLGHLATVGVAILLNLVGDSGFLGLQVGRLVRRQLAALNSLGDAVLLVVFALGDILCEHRRNEKSDQSCA